MSLSNEKFEMMKHIADGIAKQFGSNCEVVIHDYSKPFESSIVHIVNGHVTGRKVGETGSSIGLSVYAGEELPDGKYNYVSKTKTGKIVRSSTTYIKDDGDKIAGAICINYDVTEMMSVVETVQSFVNNKGEIEEESAPVLGSINDMLSEMISESIKYIGIPVDRMTREEKIIGIKFLNDRGVFSIKNAAAEVAREYKVSKFTIYNYINEKV